MLTNVREMAGGVHGKQGEYFHSNNSNDWPDLCYHAKLNQAIDIPWSSYN